LFFNIVKILEAKKPSMIFLENVKNLVSHDEGRTLKLICSDLESLGYFIKYKVLNATTHGNLPQNRERIYIVGFLDKKFSDEFSFPNPIELSKKLFGDVINLNEKQCDKYYLNNTNSASARMMIDGVNEKEVIFQNRRNYIRANKKGVCPTLTANMGTGGNNVPLILDDYGVRKLTPTECFKLQGFPDDFILPDISDSALYKQAGNSVPVPVVKRIADEIFRVMGKFQIEGAVLSPPCIHEVNEVLPQAMKQSNLRVHFSSATDLHATPQAFFDKLNAEFGFNLDVCANDENAKCETYFTKKVDGLSQDWSGKTIWMNPPYGREISRWMQKAHEASQEDTTVVCLVPARTDTKWWHEYAIQHEVRFVKGRLKFGDAKNSAPFPSAVVVMRKLVYPIVAGKGVA
jgi:DNA (cytosine-5)-methyltransferase 1